MMGNTKDEIELIELLKYFRQKKLVLLLGLVFSIFLSWAYMFYRGPIYEVKAIFIPPLTTDLSALNYNRSPITPLKPVNPLDTYVFFKNTVLANATLQEFITTNKSINRAKLSISNGVTSTEVLIAAYAAQKEEALAHFNEYIAFAQKNAFAVVLDSLIKEIDAAKSNVQKEITLATKSFSSEQDKQLVRLNQALHIAESLDKAQVSPVQNVREDIVNAAYLRGVKALKAEISSLKKQDSHNFSSPQLIALNQAYEKLEHVNLNEPLMARPKNPIVVSEDLQYVNWPRNVILSSIMGTLLCCLGLTIAFMRTTSQKTVCHSRGSVLVSGK